MHSASVELLTNEAATGAAQQWPGGRGLCTASGTFGGTSMTLEYRGAGNLFYPVKAMAGDGTRTTIALTTQDGFLFELPPCEIRAVLTGGSPSAMFASAARIPY